MGGVFVNFFVILRRDSAITLEAPVRANVSLHR